MTEGQAPELPGDPRTWREFRLGLKQLMARAELTALAVEKLSADPQVRALGADSIADSTISRKLADRDEPVDARAVRTIVTVCRVATERRGVAPADADVDRWLAARTALAEGRPPVPAPSPGPATAPGAGWRRWSAVVGAVLLVAGAAIWFTTRGTEASAPPPAVSSPAGTCGQPAERAVTAGLTIAVPEPGFVLKGDATEARGTATLLPGERPPWLLLFAVGECRYYLEQPVIMSGADWTSVIYVDPTQRGLYAVFIVMVNAEDDERLHTLAAAGGSPNIERLPASARFVDIGVRCCQ